MLLRLTFRTRRTVLACTAICAMSGNDFAEKPDFTSYAFYECRPVASYENTEGEEALFQAELIGWVESEAERELEVLKIIFGAHSRLCYFEDIAYDTACHGPFDTQWESLTAYFPEFGVIFYSSERMRKIYSKVIMRFSLSVCGLDSILRTFLDGLNGNHICNIHKKCVCCLKID